MVIPTRERRDALARALESLARQTVPAHDYEVIVSIDGSTDGTGEMVASFPAPYELRSTSGPRRGRAAACNRGISLATGEIVIVLDDDMVAAPDFIERHRRHHLERSRLCVVGAAPVQLDDRSSLAARYIKAKFDAHLAHLAEPGHRWMPRDFYTGNASLPREILSAAGGFDESFVAYGNEDVELWVRLRNAGVEFRFDPQAVAVQSYTKDFRALARDTLAKGGTAVMLARAHPDAFAHLQLAAPWEHSRPYLLLRDGVLRGARRDPRLITAIVDLAAMLERAGCWRWSLFYRAMLDLAFWAGVDEELRSGGDDGELGRLAAELAPGWAGVRRWVRRRPPP